MAEGGGAGAAAGTGGGAEAGGAPGGSGAAPAAEWFREAFRRDWLRASVPFITPERTAEEARGLERLLAGAGIAPPARVADLPCGFGRLSRPLAERGYRVAGLDLAAEQLEAAGLRPRPASLALVRGDLRALPLADASLDAALTLDVSIGYGAPEDDRRILAGIARALRPGGVFVLEQYQKRGVLARLRPSSWHEKDGVLAHAACSYDEASGRYEQRVSWRDGERSGTTTIGFRLYEADELRALVVGAGLDVVSEHGSLRTLQPFEWHLPRWVALARRRPA